MAASDIDSSAAELIEKKRASRSVLNACEALLVLMEAGEPLSLGEFARRADLNAATAHRILRSLALYQFVRQNNDGTYELGLRLLELASAVTNQFDIIDVARPHLERLAQETGETVHLAVLEGANAVYIDKVEGSHSIRLVSRPGYSVPVHATSLGKVLSAGLSETEFETLAQQLARSLDDDMLERFRSEVLDARERGHAFDREELLPDLMCVGAPIKEQNGKTIAAVSVAGPSFRMKEAIEDHAAAVCRTAAEVSAEVGYVARDEADGVGR
jgi:IclR family transcriptional regulator, KDG regulon repressor